MIKSVIWHLGVQVRFGYATFESSSWGSSTIVCRSCIRTLHLKRGWACKLVWQRAAKTLASSLIAIGKCIPALPMGERGCCGVGAIRGGRVGGGPRFGCIMAFMTWALAKRAELAERRLKSETATESPRPSAA